MKRIFWFLLNKFSANEEDRLKIYQKLYEQTQIQYNEQTNFGNIYNANIEFVIANDLIQKVVKNNDDKLLKMIEGNLIDSAKRGIMYLKHPEINDH